MKKHLHLYLFSFLLISYFSSAIGQNNSKIEGVIIDSISNNSIENANIMLFNQDSTFISGTTTDSLGNFHFYTNEVAPYILKVSSIGYKGLNYSIQKASSDIRLKLKQDNITLDEITVTSKFNRIKNDASNMIFRLTQKMRDYSSLATEILEQIPTIYVDFNNNIFVKGNGNVLILHNGIELSNNTLVNQISPQSIERVEVSRIIPTKYLAKGYSSIINIVTKRRENIGLKLHGNLSPRLNDADFNFSMDKAKHSFYTYYKLYYRDFIEYQNINDTKDNENSCQNLKTKPRKELDNEFFYGYSYNPSSKIVIGLDGYLSLYREHFLTKNITNESYTDLSDSKTRFNTQNYDAYLQYKDSIRTLSARLNYNNKSVYEGINYFRSSEDNTNEDNYRISSEIDYSRVLSQYFKLSVGANYLHTNNRNHFLYSEEENRYKYLDNSITAYLDFNIDIKNLSFLLGINYFNQNKRFQDEDINIKSSYFFPKLSSIYSINSNNSLMLNCYSTQTLPTLWQLIGNSY